MKTFKLPRKYMELDRNKGKAMKEREGEVRVRPGDRGNWRRRRNAGRSALMEMDVLDARFTSSDIKRLDSCVDVFSETGDATGFGDHRSEDSFIIEVVKKTQLLAIGRQEAETEVFIDKIVGKLGGQEQALLYVTSEITSEPRVQLLVNTLLQRGANPSASDRKLRTPLHFAVKKNFRGVASKLLENDALPHARDSDGVLPLRIALDNANDEIAALLLTYMSNWVVRSLFISDGHQESEISFHTLLRSTMQKATLSVLDCMIDQHADGDSARVYYHVLEADESGRPPDDPLFKKKDWSAFQVIAKKGDKSLVYHDVVRLLIRRKWKGYARKRFIVNSVMYALALFSLTYSAITATYADDVTIYDTPLDYSRAVFEVISYTMACFTLLTEFNQLRRNKLEYFSEAFNYIEFPSTVLLISVLPLRYTYHNEQWYVFAFGYLLMVLRIFKCAAIFRQTGAYAQILWRIVTHDFIQFTALFLVVLLGFSGSFILALKGDDNLNVHNETSTFWGILFFGVRTLTAGEPVLEYTGPNGYKTVSTLLMVCFLFVTLVIMLNILIAQLSDTYQNVQADAQRGLEVNRAWNVARVELNSWFHGQKNRLSHYVEYEDIPDLNDALVKWETPPLNEMNNCVRDICENMDTHKLNLLTIKNRLARHESTLLKIQTTLEAIHSKQNMTYQCNCICTKTEKSPHEIANEIQNPDDINLIVSESATKLGNTGKSSDTYVHNSDQQDLHDEVKNEIEEEIVHDSETDVTPRWQILRTTPTDPNV